MHNGNPTTTISHSKSRIVKRNIGSNQSFNSIERLAIIAAQIGIL
jgi:hypothetical protein